MARDKITVDLMLATKQAEREIAKINRKIKDLGKTMGKSFGSTGGGGDRVQALGTGLSKATVKADEFSKSMEASNARVIAFGASAGLIMGVDRALRAMVASSIKVEKALLDVNVVLNATHRDLEKFGKGMFKIAKDTAQGFDTVAEAAVELARQGLGMEKTLGRTKDALILTRLTGMGAADAVKTLTAAVNSFNKEGVTSAQIINRMAKVDAAFAVSSDDLAKSISRVGASAVSAGVNMNELMAITTAVQQKTARGGAVIGNAFKTIFTRLQRKDVLQNLRNLGVAVTDLGTGKALSGIQVLQNLAKEFEGLGKATQASTAEQVAGVFQVNILKAALSDLSSANSQYASSLKVANSATNEAYERNEQLNQSLDALVNRTLANLTAAGAGLGGTLEPAIKNILGTVNSVIEAFGKGGAMEGFGKTIGSGLMKGLGAFIGGPGLIVLTAVFGKVALSLGKFAKSALMDVLNINEASKQRVALEEAVVAHIASQPTLLTKVRTGTLNVLTVEKDILATIKLANAERLRIQAYAAPLTGALMGRGVRAGSRGATIPGGAGGFIPNFADAGSERAAAAAGGYRAGGIRTMSQPGAGTMMYNSAETVKRFSGMSQSAIMPPQGSPAGAGYSTAFGATHGFDPYAGRGFVPNFAAATTGLRNIQYPSTPAMFPKVGSSQNVGWVSQRTGVRFGDQQKLDPTTKGYKSALKRGGLLTIMGGGIAMLVPKGGDARPMSKPVSGEGSYSNFKASFPILSYKPSLVKNKNKAPIDIGKAMEAAAAEVTQNFAASINPPARTPNITETIQALKTTKGSKGAMASAAGAAFEVGLNLALDRKAASKESKFGDFDVRPPYAARARNKVFGGSFSIGDFKVSTSNTSKRSMAAKIAKELLKNGPGRRFIKHTPTKPKGLGFVPNFSPMTSAIGRELQAGVPASAIRVGSSPALRSSGNPGGVGVYNTIHEPAGLQQGISRATSQGMNPKSHGVPNYASVSSVISKPYHKGTYSPTLPPKITVSSDAAAKGLTDAAKAAKESAKASEQATKQTRRMGAAMGGMMVQMAMGAVASNMEEGIAQTGVKGAGSIAGFAGMGFMMGGPWGAAAGASIGALGMGAEMLTKHTDAAKESFEALSKELQKAQQDGARVTETIGKLGSTLSQLGQETDPKKRLEKGVEVASQLDTLIEQLPKGSSAADAIQSKKDLLSSGQLLTMGDLNKIAVDAELENQKYQRGLKFATAGAGARDLGAARDSWTGMPKNLTQDWAESKGRFMDRLTPTAYGGMANPIGQALRVMPSLGALVGEAVGIDDPLKLLGPLRKFAPETFQEEIARETGEAREARAAEKVPGFYKSFMGMPTLDEEGKESEINIGEALARSEKAMKVIAGMREQTAGYYSYDPVTKKVVGRIKSPQMDTFTKAGGGFEESMEKALKLAGVKDDAAAALKKQMNTPENRRAFLDMMTGRGIEGQDKSWWNLASDVKDVEGDPLRARFSKEKEEQNKAIAEAVAGVEPPPKPPTAPSGIKETRVFAEGLRKAAVAASNSLKETQLRIAGSTKIRAMEAKYEMALAGATKDTRGVAEARLAQTLKTAANNFEDASKIAKEAFNANFTKDMSTTAGKFEKFAQGENFFQGQFSDKPLVPYPPGFTGPKQFIPQIDVAKSTFKGLLEDYTGEGGVAALEKKIIAVREKKEQETTLDVGEAVIDKFGDEVLEKLKTRTEELDQKMRELGIQHSNANTIAKEQEAIDKRMLALSRELNTEKAKELRLTAVILGEQKVTEAGRRRALGQIGGKEYYRTEAQQLQDEIAQRGIRPSDFGKGVGMAFREEMAYDPVDYFNELTDGSKKLASTMKSSFADAFQSIASGANSVQGALANMAQSILNSISSISTNMFTNMMFSKMGWEGSQGGLVPRYAGGGVVTGGSGHRDDVPTMMQGGEFVIKKSSAQKIGYGTLNAINGYQEGGPAKEGGLGMGKMGLIAAGASALSGVIGTAMQPGAPKPVPSRDYGLGKGKYGYFGGADPDAGQTDMISGARGSAGVSLGKGFVYYRRDPETGRLISERARPTEGRFEVSQRLSLLGRLGEDDPQTSRMFGKERTMANYQHYLETETQSRKDQIKAVEKQKKQRLIGAYMNAAMLIGGAKLFGGAKPGPDVQGPGGMAEAFQGSGGEAYKMKAALSYVSGSGLLKQAPSPPELPSKPGPALGGYMRHYANGGGTPAMVMGGEYVMSPETVRTYGSNFMQELNRGNVPGYQGGGPVGGVSLGNQTGPHSETLIGGNTTNNVKISVNIDKNGETDASASAGTGTGSRKGDETEREEVEDHKALGELLQGVVLEEIVKQQRPGGLLRRSPNTP